MAATMIKLQKLVDAKEKQRRKLDPRSLAVTSEEVEDVKVETLQDENKRLKERARQGDLEVRALHVDFRSVYVP